MDKAKMIIVNRSFFTVNIFADELIKNVAVSKLKFKRAVFELMKYMYQ